MIYDNDKLERVGLCDRVKVSIKKMSFQSTLEISNKNLPPSNNHYINHSLMLRNHTKNIGHHIPWS